MANIAHQLALPFAHRADFAAADFLAATSNEAALAWLARGTDWPEGRLALFGEAGVGKTHLLHIWARREKAAVWSGPMLRGFAELPATGGIALDDADAANEVALFHLINAAAEAGRALLLAGRAAPSRWPVRLPDLASRLRATTAVRILPAEDALCRALLARLLAERQLMVPQSLQDWVLARLPRSQGAIREAAARLDRAGLAAGGISRAVAAQVVAVLDDAAQWDAAQWDAEQWEEPHEFFLDISPPGPNLL